MDTLFSNITVVTMNEIMEVLTDAFVGVTDGKISWLSKKAPEEQPKQIVDGTGMVLLPGMVNCHTHLTRTLFRGWADDCDEKTRLAERLYPREEQMDDRAAKAAALLGMAESLRFGVTSVSDLSEHLDAVAEAAAQCGIKANLARSTTMYLGEDFDFETYPACQELVEAAEKWHGHDNGRIKIDAAIQGEYTSDHHLWDALSEYALNTGLGMQLHLSETRAEHEDCLDRTGLTPAQVLDCHGIFSVPTQAARCGWLEPEDLRLLAKRGTSAVVCPLADQKLASGQADLMAMVRAGMNVALGTESADCANTLDLFAQMKAASLHAKDKTGDPEAVAAPAALLLATVCGARAQGRAKECGMIKPGYDADVIMVDFTQPHLIPCHNVVNNLVYAASGRDVVMTMVRGQILYAAGKYFTIDMNALMKELAEHAMPTVFREIDD